MSPRVFFIAVVLIGSKCVLIEAAYENTTFLLNKRQADTEIQTIMFGQNPEIQECLNVSYKGQPPKITGNYTINDKPLWTVVILREEVFKNKTLNIQQCSGSLIHPQVVLTAAHCVIKKSLTSLKARAGECIRRPDLFHQDRQIESIAFQDNYDAINPKRDIALLFLKHPFEMSAYISTICLPPTEVQLAVNYVQCFVTGWERKSPTLPGYKKFRKLDLSIIPSVQCEKVLQLTSLGGNFKLHKSFMCASGEFDAGVLVANGGSPLVCPLCGTNGQMIQVGVISWGFSSVPLPEVFTSISSARYWIVDEFKKRELKLPGCGI